MDLRLLTGPKDQFRWSIGRLPPGAGLHGQCALREVPAWYRSAFLYYTHAMTDSLLARAVRLLVDGEECVPDEAKRALLMRHRREFVERFAAERARADALEELSVDFFLWFVRTVRMPTMMRQRVGVEPPARPMGFLTFRTISILFEDPRRVLRMEADELDGYLESGRYLRDIRCEFILDSSRLTEQLCVVKTDALGYTPAVVRLLAESMPRKNVSVEAKKAGVMRDLEQSALFARIRAEEAVYERFLLPLAGRWHPERQAHAIGDEGARLPGCKEPAAQDVGPGTGFGREHR